MPIYYVAQILPFLFADCGKCHAFRRNKCQKHEANVVLDTAVTDGPDPEMHAILSLPKHLEVKRSGIQYGGNGVFCTDQLIEANTRFGPYQGRKISTKACSSEEENNTIYTWNVSLVTVHG